MEAQELLDNLADIHLPADPSLWPPAPGWWLLGLLLLAGIFYGYRKLLKSIVLKRRLRLALQEAEKVYGHYQDNKATSPNQAGLELLSGFNAVLKRVALLHFSQQDIASLSGQGWLNFLDRIWQQKTAKLASKPFTNGPGAALGDGSYRPEFTGDADRLYGLVKAWIKACYLGTAETVTRPDKSPGEVAA